MEEEALIFSLCGSVSSVVLVLACSLLLLNIASNRP
jgi:hypothetical protein